jgi:hypothetical protein
MSLPITLKPDAEKDIAIVTRALLINVACTQSALEQLVTQHGSDLPDGVFAVLKQAQDTAVRAIEVIDEDGATALNLMQLGKWAQMELLREITEGH